MIRTKSYKKSPSQSASPVDVEIERKKRDVPSFTTNSTSSTTDSTREKHQHKPYEGRKQEVISRHLALATRSPASSIAAKYEGAYTQETQHVQRSYTPHILEWRDERKEGNRNMLAGQRGSNSNEMRTSSMQETVVSETSTLDEGRRDDNRQVEVSFSDSRSVRAAAFEEWAARKQATASVRHVTFQPHQASRNTVKRSDNTDATFNADKDRQVTVVKENTWADSSTMRKAIYAQWLTEKDEREKQERNEKLGKQKKEKEELARTMKEKKVDSQRAFETWKEKKTEKLKERLQTEKMVLKHKEIEKKEKEQTQAHESNVLFKSWKEKKDDLITKQHSEIFQQKCEERKMKEAEVQKKKEENRKTYDKW